MNETSTELYVLIGIVAAVCFFVLLLGFFQVCNDFSNELRYLNSEIRCTYGAERRHWKRQRRRLWLSLLPFVKY